MEKKIENPNELDIVDLIARAVVEDESVKTQVQRRKYLNNFMAYVRDAWKIIEPGVEYSHNWHIEYLYEEVLTMFGHIDSIREIYPDADWDKINEETTRRMVINVPTRSMKTVLISVMLPTWLILHRPTLKFATVSYSDDLATEINDKRRTIISSDWYKQHFGDIIQIKQGSDRKDRIEFTSQGMMYSTSIGGVFTGKGADVIILDDPQKPKDMETEGLQDKAIKFFTDTLPTRIDNPNEGVIINIQQRLHSDDLTGFILETRPNYRLVKIPLEFVEEQTFIAPLTGRVIHKKEGEVMWPSRLGKKAVSNLRLELGPRNFEAQQQQNPTPEGGAIMELEWFARYPGTPKQLLEGFKKLEPDVYERLDIVLSWDMSYSDKQSKDTDYVGFVAGAYDYETETTYILDAWKKKMAFTQTVEEVIAQRDKYLPLGLPVSILIEKKANGGPIIELLDNKITGVIPYDPGANKIARMKSATPAVSSGHVLVPEDKAVVPWREILLHDVVKFPHVRHDDLADAFSQLVIYNHITRTDKGKQDFNIWVF